MHFTGPTLGIIPTCYIKNGGEYITDGNNVEDARLACWLRKYAEVASMHVLQELHMTGCMLMADDFCLVIAEGSLKSHKKYGRLMLNRIDWNQTLEDEQQGE